MVGIRFFFMVVIGLVVLSEVSCVIDNAGSRFAAQVQRDLGIPFEPVKKGESSSQDMVIWIGYLSDPATLPVSDGYFVRLSYGRGMGSYTVVYIDQTEKPIGTIIDNGRTVYPFVTKFGQKKLITDQFLGADGTVYPSVVIKDIFDNNARKKSLSVKNKEIVTADTGQLSVGENMLGVMRYPATVASIPFELFKELPDGSKLVWGMLPGLADQVLINIGHNERPLVDPVTAKTNFFYVTTDNPLQSVTPELASKRSGLSAVMHPVAAVGGTAVSGVMTMQDQNNMSSPLSPAPDQMVTKTVEIPVEKPLVAPEGGSASAQAPVGAEQQLSIAPAVVVGTVVKSSLVNQHNTSESAAPTVEMPVVSSTQGAPGSSVNSAGGQQNQAAVPSPEKQGAVTTGNK